MGLMVQAILRKPVQLDCTARYNAAAYLLQKVEMFDTRQLPHQVAIDKTPSNLRVILHNCFVLQCLEMDKQPLMLMAKF